MNHYEAAVDAWLGANHDLRKFAECCAFVEGKQTQALAADCKLSVDAIEAYRNAYKLFREMQTMLEVPGIGVLWTSVNISLWIATAKRRKGHQLTYLYEVLCQAHEHGWTVEQFRALMDNDASPRPEWLRRFERIAKGFAKLATDYKGVDMPEAAKTRLEKLADYVASELQAIVAMEAE